jgi:LacI family repressor for deo operon, udp, cdd, tsx, nupC, and nupG
MVSISDVSRAAGVSVATVSRALTMPEMVAKSTRARVLRVVEELGYKPNLLARSLRSQESRLIVVLVTNISNPFFSKVIRGIEKVAQEMGYSAMLGDTQNDDLIEARYIGLLSAKQVDGVIQLSSRLHGRVFDLILKESPDAAVVNACACLDAAPCSTVGVDDVGAARVMTEHLLSLGHRRIAVIAGPSESPHSRDRMFGHRLELRAAGVLFDESLIVNGEFSLASGAEAADRVLAMPNRPTAIFCFNDEMAIGAIQRLTHAGCSVPQEMSVAGFDDIEFAAYATPALTTIAQPALEMGKTAMELLYRRIKGETKSETVTLATELKVRSTTAPPKA